MWLGPSVRNGDLCSCLGELGFELRSPGSQAQPAPFQAWGWNPAALTPRPLLHPTVTHSPPGADNRGGVSSVPLACCCALAVRTLSHARCICRFIFAMPPVEAPAITIHTSHPPPSLLLHQAIFKETLRREISPRASGLHRIVCNMRTQFPDLRLIQYDCGMWVGRAVGVMASWAPGRSRGGVGSREAGQRRSAQAGAEGEAEKPGSSWSLLLPGSPGHHPCSFLQGSSRPWTCCCDS